MNDVPLLRASTENEFKRLFFEQMHLFKARANMSDYADLNRRYFKTTDTVIFADGKVELDVLPRCWLSPVIDDLPNIAFIVADNLPANVDLSDIARFLAIDERQLYENLQKLYGVTITTAADANRVIYDERYRRFNALIDERFNRAALIDLFRKFERREDNAIRQVVTNNADIPTIFEYIIGIAWYLISDRRGDVLGYMNLSLEADLLPRTHAAGGNADIEYIYEQTADYPAHCLLIEATLSDGANQRRMEMEPVSRHLGEYILSNGGMNAYCVFVSTFLHRNVISDFRNRRTYQYYSDKFESVVDGLKILPLATAEIRGILERGIGYERLYALFESACRSDEPVPTWYEREVAGQL
ncbi:MAG: AlwI family type II restriction endonuclease [Clostridiales bacterium]|nr:AlwI family type II restriction endonuclease [Clostridiales bacterium]